MSNINVEKTGVALLASRLSLLGVDPCGGSEVILWEDVRILEKAGIPVRVYGRTARSDAPVHAISLRTRNPQLSSLEYAGNFLQRERKAAIITYNEPAPAGWAPERTIARFDWYTPLPRYWSWPFWLSRFQRAQYLFPSENERQLFALQHARIPCENLSVIPNAVNLDIFKPKGLPLGVSKNKLSVGFAGQWIPRKGIGELLSAWQIVKAGRPDAELRLAGGPSMWKNAATIEGADECAAKVRVLEERGLLSYVGALPRSQMPAFWNSVDIAVVPSLYEPFGLVAIEALACGVPVIAAAVGGLEEVVQDGESGLLVPPGDVEALAHAISALLSNEPLRRQLSEGARRRALAFSLERRSRDLIRMVLGFGERKADQRKAVEVGA